MESDVSLPEVGVKDLLEAGLHFGHQTKRWNPKMAPYIFGDRNGIYVIDLGKTLNQILEKFITEFLPVRPVGRTKETIAGAGIRTFNSLH